ncbi:MAG: hypothetical protein WCJ30_22645, partial [Deltaproteobacteria bacterium]
PAWIATLRQHAATLATEQGPARVEHCARIAALEPPDAATMQAQQEERTRHFLDTGSPDPATAVGADDMSTAGGAALETIVGLCAITDAAR